MTDLSVRPAEPEILGLAREPLAALLAPHLDRPFRARQIFDAIHRRAVTDFAEMTDLSRALREELAAAFSISLPEIASRVDSADGTTKFLLRLSDGATIEAVDIPDDDAPHALHLEPGRLRDWRAPSASPATGGPAANLTAGEIVGQVMLVQDRPEPAAGASISSSWAWASRCSTWMTSGRLSSSSPSPSPGAASPSRPPAWCPGIDAMASWERRPNLAVSLHAPDDARRDEIMPINRSYPLPELLDALRRYPLEPRRRITFEYILIAGFNDSPDDAAALARLLRELPVKVNLIPFNPDPVLGERFHRPQPDAISAFQERARASAALHRHRPPHARRRRRRRLRTAARLRSRSARLPARAPRGGGQAQPVSRINARLRPPAAPSRR